MTTSTMDNRVKQIVSNIRNLPTPPIVFHQIQKVINDPKCSASQISSILSEDPAMSVKVLKLTNSAFYGLSREIDSVRQAVVIVGIEAIRNLVISASVLEMFKGREVDQEFEEKFWRHSLATAFCCRILARQLRSRGIVDPDGAFSGGLLHDVGKIVLSCFLPEEYRKFEEERRKDAQSPTFEVEERALGYNHAQVGTLLAGHWKLPGKLTQAITFHHHPQLSEIDEPIAHIVHIANYVAKKTFYPAEDEYLIGAIDSKVYSFMGLSEPDVDMFSEMLRDEYVKAETFMKMAGIK